MVFKYLGRHYDVDTAWRLIYSGSATLVSLTHSQLRSIVEAQRPESIKVKHKRGGRSEEIPLVLVRDAIPSSGGPDEVVAVLVDGWDSAMRVFASSKQRSISAWVIEDTDLVSRLVVKNQQEDRIAKTE